VHAPVQLIVSEGSISIQPVQIPVVGENIIVVAERIIWSLVNETAPHEDGGVEERAEESVLFPSVKLLVKLIF
jgi:hypothetical protein